MDKYQLNKFCGVLETIKNIKEFLRKEQER